LIGLLLCFLGCRLAVGGRAQGLYAFPQTHCLGACSDCSAGSSWALGASTAGDPPALPGRQQKFDSSRSMFLVQNGSGHQPCCLERVILTLGRGKAPPFEGPAIRKSLRLCQRIVTGRRRSRHVTLQAGEADLEVLPDLGRGYALSQVLRANLPRPDWVRVADHSTSASCQVGSTTALEYNDGHRCP
jgi:hypothetical protein